MGNFQGIWSQRRELSSWPCLSQCDLTLVSWIPSCGGGQPPAWPSMGPGIIHSLTGQGFIGVISVYGRNDGRPPLSLSYRNCSFCLRQHVLWGKPAASSWGYSGNPEEGPTWKELRLQTNSQKGAEGSSQEPLQWVFSEAESGIVVKVFQYNAAPSDLAPWETRSQSHPALGLQTQKQWGEVLFVVLIQ